MTGKKYEPPLHLDIDFAEALERFGATDKKEVDELIAQAKKKKPPKDKPPAAKKKGGDPG
ncbi:hypothetical protein EN828_23090 [Mesorhizobium sp. M2D.F.Ca.ET.185.01.1.1]|uniref:hypothetical protein n=1 Tax=unclassified Mesorhizobium TaxID=325217 RepID=UPI000FCCA114|nr:MULTISPECIES: hypothetical protein [unclassified Mesorhizobium]TGP77071.1 hypothetical protein EN870_20885 [bacterium M00.F.Ca.ET.227.01.1.1]TGP84062.1 hypothetical protein EN864_32210 [bacterium M00.F.Ca.ET.221.01.1.1]TGP88587.1 hypothetical protein EN865_26540 [bacterium M00.F.Ca.ET.222.01.1.1]TGU03135.1 hypothetical protein EN806_42770 [bacterium M00.F.Ca.ET.163.01.1.1]TGU30818.1 hypothetical protein EN799_30950 [bacterium M00.F.Ca.ET.156.01.1.1]TGU45074.1 hypothetical protein EN789_207